ncbi:MAG: lipocalin family protein [Akkermansiaceae bacterium]
MTATILTGFGSVACQTTPESSQPVSGKLQAISRPIELEKFMGDWYVIAHIPTFIEDKAYNAVETYELAEDGTIPTTYRFNSGGFDGPLKTLNPKGFVHNQETNTEWRMQFFWPFKAAYLITYLSEDYQTTIIGVPNRNYAWIMAREKHLSNAAYEALVAELKAQGHDISKLRKVPHE